MEYKDEIKDMLQDELKYEREKREKISEDIGEIKGDIKVILEKTKSLENSKKTITNSNNASINHITNSPDNSIPPINH